jgi:hypothetical protein
MPPSIALSKKVMIAAWGNAIADNIKRKDVLEWLQALDYCGPTIGKITIGKIKGIMHAVYETLNLYTQGDNNNKQYVG